MSVHPTAIIETGVTVGRGTTIREHVHVKHSTSIGSHCVIEDKSYIANNVRIGDSVRIDAFVCVSEGSIIENGVRIGAGTVFAGGEFAQNGILDGASIVREGASIGAHCVIEYGVTIGRFSLAAAGSVLTANVPDLVLMRGNPALPSGYMCVCGYPLLRDVPGYLDGPLERACARCSARYGIAGATVTQF